MDASLPTGKELRPQNAEGHEQPSVRNGGPRAIEVDPLMDTASTGPASITDKRAYPQPWQARPGQPVWRTPRVARHGEHPR
jgi:hypothetical protein